MSWRLRLLQGDAASALLRDDAFVRDWQSLAAADTKKHTWFQQPFFCNAWYAAYAGRMTPLLVAAEDDSGLRGVMPLATRLGEVVHAGAHQCQYQGWIADPAIDVDFGRRAVQAVLAQGGASRWQWRYVAPGTPDGWLLDPGAPHLGEVVNAPLLRAADQAFLAERLRGSLRNLRNRLLRRGLRYRRIDDADEARALMPRLARWCDLRQAAAHATLPFADDDAKLPLHERLLQNPEQVWLSAYYLHDAPIAAHLGFLHEGELAVGIQGYDPGESRSSPGALLLLDVAADLASSGAHTLDLTPGGDAWKERFASHHRSVHRLVLHRSRAAALAEQTQRGLRASARRALGNLGADRLRRAVEAAPAVPLASLDVIDVTTLPAPAMTMSAAAEDIETALLQQAAAAGAGQASDWLQEAMRRLGSGWRAAAGCNAAGQRVLLWGAPADAGVDATDPAAPKLSQEGRDPATLVVRADAAGSMPPTSQVGDALAAALACWDERPRHVWLLSDPEARDVRAWVRQTPSRLRRAG